VTDRPAPPRRDPRKRGPRRRAHLAARFGGVDPGLTAAAIASRRRQLASIGALAAPPGPPGPLQPDSVDRTWIPIGPSVVLTGAGGGRPRVSGRATDVRVSPDGRHVYAATADGGVWFSGDGGTTWAPLGGWAVTATPASVVGTSNVCACGCLFVRFDAAGDEVLVGTGERVPLVERPHHSGYNAGVGVLRAVNPSAADPFAQVWQVEATNLSGLGIFRIAVDPTTPTTFIAATSSGLWMRTGAPSATWVLVPAAPFNTVAGTSLVVSDVVWTAAQGVTPARLWIGVNDPTGANSGVWFADNWTPVNPPAFTQLLPAGLGPDLRVSIAVAPSNPTIAYLLAEGGLLWRLDGAPLAATPVIRIPPNTQIDEYTQAIAVHPTRPERIIFAGQNIVVDGAQCAAMYLGNVTGPVGGNFRFDFTSPAAHPERDDSFIGFGVHPDVHALRFVPIAGGGTQIWVACDGGIYRSTQGDADNRVVKRTFASQNDGLATLQTGYVATHPSVEGYLLTGAHDNGTLERVGDTVWRARFRGDGGGVIFNPLAPERFFYQNTETDWNDDGNAAYTRPVRRSNADVTLGTAAEQQEESDANFYSGCDAILVAGAPAARGTRLAFGTIRVWMSEDWGATWRTVPSLTDPMAVAAQSSNTDACVLVGGTASRRGRVLACRWASPTRLFVLCSRGVFQFDLLADAGVPGGLRATKTELTRQATHKSQDRQASDAVASPGQVLPAIGSWSDLAVHDPGRESHGSFYVTTTGHLATPKMDTLWWFDGKDRWHATNLRNDPINGIPAPAYAVVVDPANRDIVYVGTSVGVWRGTLRSGPKWDWHVLSNGLPEAPVHDLTITMAGGTRILRAAITSRGIWEVELTSDGTPRTFVRVHAYDARRDAAPAVLTDPKSAVPNSALSWHASPDVRVRPRQGSRPPAPRGLPWTSGANDQYGLWVFQTALRTQARFRQCPANGLWSMNFDGCVRTLNAGATRVTQANWNAIVGAGTATPNAYADPWNGTTPSEADLFEFIVDQRAPAGSDASMGIRPVRARVDVCVHHRDLRPVPAASVKVTLLRRDVAHTGQAAWAALPDDWTPMVQAFLRAGAGAAPALPAGWTFADAATPIRDASGPIDARLPRATTFDVDFRGVAAGTRILLVAVVHSTDQVVLPAQTLQTLTLGTRFVAVRSVVIV
jgi:hypothetical protein